MLRQTLCALLVGLTAACSSDINQLALTPEPSDLELRPLVGSAMVRTVSLPSYAAAEEVPRQKADGLITSSSSVYWADAPDRAVTLVLAQTLSDILNTKVGPEPWPFVGLPDVAIDVRVSRMLAMSSGQFELNGQFFVGGDGINYPNSVQSFAISVPLPSQSLENIVSAQTTALRILSEQIARTLGR